MKENASEMIEEQLQKSKNIHNSQGITKIYITPQNNYIKRLAWTTECITWIFVVVVVVEFKLSFFTVIHYHWNRFILNNLLPLKQIFPENLIYRLVRQTSRYVYILLYTQYSQSSVCLLLIFSQQQQVLTSANSMKNKTR